MVRRTIEYVTESGSGMTITYSKDNDKPRIFHLNNIKYHPQYGKNYIVGFCYDSQSDLTFKVAKIINADIEWIDVLNVNMPKGYDGLYLISKRGDMCLGFDLKGYKAEEWSGYISDIFQRNDDILAFHYIPYYHEDTKGKWTQFTIKNIELNKGIYIFAYTVDNSIQPKEDEEEYDTDWSYWSKQINHNGICYCPIFEYCSHGRKLKIPDNVNILAYHYCSLYNEKDHAFHWELARKLGLI